MTTGQILLVDDDPALLQALARTILLRMSGVQVQTATDASTALRLLQEQEYDAIVSDIKLPGMDGLALLDRIAHQYPETPVILITGHGEHDVAIRALRGGAYDYILKPIDREEFLASLQRALQTHQLRQQIQVQQHALERYALSLEQQVQERTSELVTTNATKDALLSLVAQELASPLTSLKGLTQLVDRQVQQQTAVETIRQNLGDMACSIHRLEQMVQDVQETSLIQRQHVVLQRRSCDLVDLCRQVLADLTAGGGTVPIYEVLDEPLEADVDPERISQVLLNLLSNARKYSPQAAPTAILMRRAGEEARISVRDQGLGIAVEQLACITEPFYRVPGIDIQTGSSRGLGLGLYLVRTIVEQHGGRLEVHSREGEDSTFSLVLPLV